MKNFLQLPRLATHPKYNRLCLFHKRFNHNAFLHTALILPTSYVSFRTDHTHKVGIMTCLTSVLSVIHSLRSERMEPPSRTKLWHPG